jgi:hypothetical protein
MSPRTAIALKTPLTEARNAFRDECRANAHSIALSSPALMVASNLIL